MPSTLPKRADNYAAWYNELVKKAGLAENAAVRGCMVVKPYGFALWEKMKVVLDQAFKNTGHENAYFPLFIPKSYLNREADHIEGFAKECAVVTHYRLKNSSDGSGVVVDPEAKLEEELIVRPTSETIIWHTYKNWIQSYRDLPLLVNQWSNVVRWEMRTRLFLRTAEILWQEGHTAHATRTEAEQEALQMLHVYDDFAKNYMAVPFLKGIKTEHERFAGAEETYTIEALMQDGKALQAGTSHFLGQKFAQAFDVTFANRAGKLEYVWGTSWGVTTRLIGALIMTHSDDEGLVLPPQLAPIQVVIIPIYKGEAERQALAQQALQLKEALQAQGIAVKLDDRDTHKPGWKFAEYELKGVPLRMAVGPKDLAHHTVELARRDTKEKITVSMDQVVATVKKLLTTIQAHLYQRALAFREAHTTQVDTYQDFKEVLARSGGFVLAHWDGTTETEKKIQAATKATIRCIPLDAPQEPGKCIYTGRLSQQRAVFAQAY
ncbi:MAG: proline--tRNA ligase [Roseivirga sp.]